MKGNQGNPFGGFRGPDTLHEGRFIPTYSNVPFSTPFTVNVIDQLTQGQGLTTNSSNTKQSNVNWTGSNPFVTQNYPFYPSNTTSKGGEGSTGGQSGQNTSNTKYGDSQHVQDMYNNVTGINSTNTPNFCSLSSANNVKAFDSYVLKKHGGGLMGSNGRHDCILVVII